MDNPKIAHIFASLLRNTATCQSKGEMAEWSIAAVLKTVEGNTSGGSNPSLSAKKKETTSVLFPFFISLNLKGYSREQSVSSAIQKFPVTSAVIASYPVVVFDIRQP